MYEIRWSMAAARSLRKLERPVRLALNEAVLALAANPRPAQSRKLSGTGNQYRVRVGDYRVIYEVQDGLLVIVVVALGHRREVYR